MRKISLVVLLSVLVSMGFGVTLNYVSENVIEVNANFAVTCIADISHRQWKIIPKDTTYISFITTADPTVDSPAVFQGAYTRIKLKRNQTQFKLLGTATSNVTIFWENPAYEIEPLSSGYIAGSSGTFYLGSPTAVGHIRWSLTAAGFVEEYWNGTAYVETMEREVS